MNNSTKAFIISLIIHVSLFGMFLDFEPQKIEKKEVVVLNMNMIQNISQIEKEPIQETSQKVEDKIEQEEILEEPKPEPKKEIIKKIKKEIKKVKTEPLKKVKKEPKIEEKKEVVKKEEVNQNLPTTKEPIQTPKKTESEENYQQKYLDDNLASIIKAIKKYKNYPYQAKKRGMTGKVIIQCTIKTNGKIENLKIIEASKYTLLNENSLEILTKASKEFVAPKKDVTLSIPFNYELN